MDKNTTELEYISIYDRPKRRGAPRGSKYTDEEKAERARISTKNYYYRNIEKEQERKRLYYIRKKRKQQQILFKLKMFVLNFFFRFIIFEFPLKEM